jgi:uncharacterized membrane protein YkoI
MNPLTFKLKMTKNTTSMKASDLFRNTLYENYDRSAAHTLRHSTLTSANVKVNQMKASDIEITRLDNDYEQQQQQQQEEEHQLRREQFLPRNLSFQQRNSHDHRLSVKMFSLPTH